MRRILSLCASTLLAAGMLMAQTSSPAAPPPQDQNASASQDQNATKPADRSAAKPSDTTAGADQNAAAATTDNSKSKPDPNAQPARAESPDAAAPNPTNAARDTRGGAPWLWVILGAVALIALLSLLGGRGPAERGDRVTPIDRTREYHRRIDDRDDDIRRAS
jgi:hypothetical protein